MLEFLVSLWGAASKWANDNQGVVSILIFLVTIGFGWASGIITGLRRRPVFEIDLIDGPTFCCTYPVGKVHGDHEVHRTGIALYILVSNIGSAASSIQNISIGYHWNLHRFSLQWFKFSLGWFWLTEQTPALRDFQAKIGNDTKIYPFLTQINSLSPSKAESFLEVGKSLNGVVYFEQSDSWGGCFPADDDGHAQIKVRIRDVFGNQHKAKFKVPIVSLEYARRYNPAFGATLAELNSEHLPYDQPT